MVIVCVALEGSLVCHYTLASLSSLAVRLRARLRATLRMVRTRSQRAAMLLRLPTDVLFKIASHTVAA